MQFQDILEDGAVIAGTSMATAVFAAATAFVAVTPSPIPVLINDPDRLAKYTEHCENVYTGTKILVTDEAGVIREAIPIIEAQECLNGLHKRDEETFTQSRIANSIFLGGLALFAGGAAISGMRGKNKYEGWHPLIPSTW